MSAADITVAEIGAVSDVLRSPHLSMGPNILRFEELLAERVQKRHGIGVSSGTAGLHLCVIGADVKDGDLVITTPFSFVASANVILYERAVPIFVDVDPRTLNMDPSQVAEAVVDLKSETKRARRWLPPALQESDPVEIADRLKAILVVHVFGQPADMAPIMEVAKKHDLAVIEDACEAIGAEYDGRPAGSLGDTAVFAFYPNKQMTAGEGGMIVTDDDDLESLFRSLRNQGRDIFDSWLTHSRLGFNYRLDEMSAALGAAQLERFDQLLARRERVAGWYNKRLEDVNAVTTPFVPPTTTRESWFVYVVRLASHIDRDAVMVALEGRGVPSRAYFSPIHLQPFYRERFGFREGQFPVTEAAAKATLALPFFGRIGEELVDHVCQELVSVLEEQRRVRKAGP